MAEKEKAFDSFCQYFGGSYEDKMCNKSPISASPETQVLSSTGNSTISSTDLTHSVLSSISVNVTTSFILVVLVALIIITIFIFQYLNKLHIYDLHHRINHLQTQHQHQQHQDRNGDKVEDEENQCWSILSIRPRHFVHIVGPIGLLVQNTLKTILVVDFLWFKVYGSWWNLCRERILSIYPTERITKTVGERGVSVRLIILLNHGHGHSWWWDEDEMLVIFILSSLVHNFSPT